LFRNIFLIFNPIQLIKHKYFLSRELSNESKWCALDTGNIIIHLFLPEAREYYDLETLWACGAEFDEKCLSFAKEQYNIEQKLLVVEE